MRVLLNDVNLVLSHHQSIPSICWEVAACLPSLRNRKKHAAVSIQPRALWYMQAGEWVAIKSAGLTCTRLRDQSSLKPAESCLSSARAVASGMRFWRRMNLAMSPPAQYSMTRNILPVSCKNNMTAMSEHLRRCCAGYICSCTGRKSGHSSWREIRGRSLRAASFKA